MSEDQVRVVPLNWLKVKNIYRFLGKQLSDYAGINAPKHKAFLAEIGFTITNCEIWVAFLLREKSFATIHSFSRGANNFRINYEIAIPLDKETSTAYQQGCAGSDKKFKQLDYLSYTLVIQHDYDSTTGEYSKVGEPVTGFLRDTAYNFREETGLSRYYLGTTPWSGHDQNLQIYQSQMASNLVKQPPYGNLRVLPLQGPLTQDESDVMKIINAPPTKKKKKARSYSKKYERFRE